MLGPSSSTVPLPVTLTLPVGLTVAPFSNQKFPATPVRPVSALLLVSLPASATNDFAPSSQSVPLTVAIWPLLNSRSASFSRKTVPVSTPAVPNPAAALATFRVDWTVALPSILISLVLPLESPPVPFTVKVSAEVMPVLPTEMPLPLVLLLVRVPPIVRLLPPEPPMLGPSSSTVPLPVTRRFHSPIGSDRDPAIASRPPETAIECTLIPASPLRSSGTPLLMTTLSPEPGSLERGPAASAVGIPISSRAIPGFRRHGAFLRDGALREMAAAFEGALSIRPARADVLPSARRRFPACQECPPVAHNPHVPLGR